jgi:23S rRNA (cytidine1920-2'-O)/16S rRNA (cytidine1409-2'-O)-methyltransferase
MAKVRLDALLARRGLFESRSRAASAVLAGEVVLGRGRQRAEKPGALVDEGVEVEVLERAAYVSRGGIKLANALVRTGLPVADRQAIDVGAGTGGFTDCLLQRGARRVVAVDVGYGGFDWRLRNDPRVTVIERCNARSLQRAMLPFTPDLAVVDVSFISVVKVLEAVLACLEARFDCLALVKPQFEVGRELVGRGGVVRDSDARRGALVAVGEAVRGLGASVLGFASSGLPGPKGNLETFVRLSEAGRAGAARERGDVERMAEAAEPRGAGRGAA